MAHSNRVDHGRGTLPKGEIGRCTNCPIRTVLQPFLSLRRCNNQSLPYSSCRRHQAVEWGGERRLTSFVCNFEFKRDAKLAENPADLGREVKAAHRGGRERHKQAALAAL